MRHCERCEQANPEEAVYCLRCGTRFEEPAVAEPVVEAREEAQLWRLFIGQARTLTFSLPNGWQWESADTYYLRQFRKFQTGPTPGYALTWHWPAFLIDPFLWFLYRKMYLYAAVYLVGPVIAFALTGDVTVGFIWRVIAGGSANYLYYWHVREHLRRIRHDAGPSLNIPDSVLRDAGGAQPYVFVLGILLHLFVVLVILQGPPDQGGSGQEGMLGNETPSVF